MSQFKKVNQKLILNIVCTKCCSLTSFGERFKGLILTDCKQQQEQYQDGKKLQTLLFISYKKPETWNQ